MAMKRRLRQAAKRTLNADIVQQTLATAPVKRVLGGTRIYPRWVRNLREQYRKYPDWTEILGRDARRWEAARAAAARGPAVLIPVSPGDYALESTLAVALTLRGARAHLVLCDGYLGACYLPQIIEFPDTAAFARHGPARGMCGDCFGFGFPMIRALGLPTHLHSQLVTGAEARRARELADAIPTADIPPYRLEGVAVGEQAFAGAIRFYRRGDLDGEPDGDAVLRRYFHGALLAVSSARRLMRGGSFSCLVAHHGMYVPHGVYVEVARQCATSIVTWATGYRNQTLIFGHGGTYHRTILAEPTAVWEDMPWTPEMEEDILRYLRSRWQGTDDWISYQKDTRTDSGAIAAELGVDYSKPTIGLLTNSIWDAQLLYPSNAFPVMMDWVLQTIRYFEQRPELQLLIRLHPAELGSRERVSDRIAREIPTLPPNVVVIKPEQRINTYAAMMPCDSVLIYGTKAGLELTSLGIPVIVAGESWIRNKGLTLDASSPEEYFALLDRLPLGRRLDEAVVRRARKYAYHFFLRQMIQMEFFRPPALPILNVEIPDLDSLAPGRSVGLDVLCDGILNDGDLLYPLPRSAAVAGAAADVC